jgi:hypothetical protein
MRFSILSILAIGVFLVLVWPAEAKEPPALKRVPTLKTGLFQEVECENGVCRLVDPVKQSARVARRQKVRSVFFPRLKAAFSRWFIWRQQRPKLFK